MFFLSPDTRTPHHDSQSLVAGTIVCGMVKHRTGKGMNPWQSDDAYSFGLVYHILQSGDWLVPTLAGEPHMDKPPLCLHMKPRFFPNYSPLYLSYMTAHA